MNTLDLGNLEGPLVFFGGPYSNLHATQAIHSETTKRGITAKNIICTGDVVAYCAQPNETIKALRDWGVTVLMGNCEESIGWSTDDCGCGFATGSACDILSNTWYNYTNHHVETAHRTWMRTLPKRINFSYAGRHFAVIHGSVSRINQFVFASTDHHTKHDELALAGTDGVIGGHCGLPFTQQINDKLWHNPGVIGMPANDGTQRGWYSIWQQDKNQIRIDHLAVNVDALEANNAMASAGLSNAYADSLLTGLWPSMDILPTQECTQRGTPLSPRTHYF